MNISNMAKGMNEVQRFDEWAVDGRAEMAKDDCGEYVLYTDYDALQQQLAAAREAIKSLERDARAWRNRFIDERMNVYCDFDYEMRRCHAESDANEFIEKFHTATLQRDRQP